MSEHSAEPWVKGAWEQEYRGRKLFYVFRSMPQNLHSDWEVWSGVKSGDSFHCSEKQPGKKVIGMDFDYSNSTLVFEDVDIERTVACVNACNGFSTEALEDLASRGGTLADINALIRKHGRVVVEFDPEAGKISATPWE